MTMTMNRRVSFSPGVDGPDTPSPPQLYLTKHGADTPEPVMRIWTFGSQKSSGFSAMRFLGRIKAKFARALGFVSSTRKITSSTTCSSCDCTLKRSRSYVEAFDSHRAQAIEDCIQFLNSSSSSSSFQRSKSVSSFCY